MGKTNLSGNLIVLIAKEVKAASWLWVNKTKPIKKNLKACIYRLCTGLYYIRIPAALFYCYWLPEFV